MDEDRERTQWRIRIGLEKEQKPIVIRRADMKKRAERRKNRKKYQ